MTAEVRNFEDWHQGFKAHATETTFSMNGTTYTVSMARNAACDEGKTEVFCDVEDPNKLAITLFALDMAKFGPVMAEPAFEEMSKAAIVSQDPPSIIANPPGESATPNMFMCVEVEDPEAWIAGFKAHADSKTGTWGFEVPITRGEFVDESKTRLFKSATRANVVGCYMEAVDMSKLGPMLANPEFQQLASQLGEKAETKVMKVVTPAPMP